MQAALAHYETRIDVFEQSHSDHDLAEMMRVCEHVRVLDHDWHATRGVVVRERRKLRLQRFRV